MVSESITTRCSLEPYANTMSYSYPIPTREDLAHLVPFDSQALIIGPDLNSDISNSYNEQVPIMQANSSPDFSNYTFSPRQSSSLNQFSESFSPELDFITGVPSPHTPSLYNDIDASSTAPSTPMLFPSSVSMRSSVSSLAHEYRMCSLGAMFDSCEALIKTEDDSGWALDPILMDIAPVAQLSQCSTTSVFPSSTITQYSTQPDLNAWNFSPMAQYLPNSSCQETGPLSIPTTATHQASRPRLSSVARTKAPRKMTTKEEANYICKVNGCGKFFSRSYNFKAHQETHSSNREYGFPCTVAKCTKKFVRKTDLQRHCASVHEKNKQFSCDFCQRNFARKDTLRR